MWTYFIGPFLALLPKRWRPILRPSPSLNWMRAGILSGFGEGVVALIALMYWYSYSVPTWISRGLDAATEGRMSVEVTDHEIGFMAIMIFATHPLTWIVLYGGLEGSVRLLTAAFGENCLGILPLYLADRAFLKMTGRNVPDAKTDAGFTQGNIASYVEAVKEKLVVHGLPQLADEIFVRKEDDGEFLEIHASGRKHNWDPPRTVRFQDEFFRLEEFFKGSLPRPFRYRLRRVAAGVMSRTVLDYVPGEAVMHDRD